jgi:hypothetical protein
MNRPLTIRLSNVGGESVSLVIVNSHLKSVQIGATNNSTIYFQDATFLVRSRIEAYRAAHI